MYPDLFGIPNGSYTFMMIIAIIVALALLVIYFKREKINKVQVIDLLITSFVTVIFGIIFAILFQNLYNYIENPSAYKWTWGMTFIGGLIGGVISFLAMYFAYYRRHNGPLMYKILTIVPAALCIGHAIGRIGCFLAGCCYGKETTEWYGMYFPAIGKTVIPTQLYEAIFLFVLGGVLLFFAFYKRNFPLNMTIYMASYAVFRFLIEYLRDDHRGSFIPGISPSQFWCILLFIGAIVLCIFTVVLKKFKTPENDLK